MDLSAQLERFVAGYRSVTGGVAGQAVAGCGTPASVRNAVLRAVGVSPPLVEDVTDMWVMRDGASVAIGRCVPPGAPAYSFDGIIPHLGVAFDYTPRTDDEVQRKAAWCKAKGVHYAHGSVEEIAAVVATVRKSPPRPPTPRPPCGDPQAEDKPGGFRVWRRWIMPR